MHITNDDIILGIKENYSENGWRWLNYLRNNYNKRLKNCIKYFGPNKIFHAGGKYRMDGLTKDESFIIFYNVETGEIFKMSLKNFISFIMFYPDYLKKFN